MPRSYLITMLYADISVTTTCDSINKILFLLNFIMKLHGVHARKTIKKVGCKFIMRSCEKFNISIKVMHIHLYNYVYMFLLANIFCI